MKQGNLGDYNSVTIRDVAEAAGVSIATVSRILNRSAGVSSSLEQKVREVIERLGYESNGAARTLKGKDSYSIGLIIPDIQNPYFPALVRSIEDAARKTKHAVLLCNSDGIMEEEMRYIRFLQGRQVDGILFIAGPDSAASVELAQSLHVPLVLLDREVEGKDLPAVLADNAHGAKLAVEHLIHCGCKEIAFIGSQTLSAAKERFAGYSEVLRKAGRPVCGSLIKEEPFTFDGGYQGTERLLKERCSFDAIFVGNDVMAFGAIACLRQYGLRTPQDVQVVGFDDIWMAKWNHPSLTTLRQPVDEIGRTAVDMLIGMKRGAPRGKISRRFLPQLIVRDSTKNIVGE